MIILIGSQKGGCGKSTLAVNICAELARLGKDVCLVDGDRQGTSSRFIQDRSESDYPIIHCVSMYDNIHQNLKDLNNRYEIIVVDVAGRDSRELRTGMLTANILLTPFRPSQPDLDTLPHLVDVITQARDMNPDLKCKAVLTLAPSNPQINEANEAKEYLSEFPELELCRSVIRDRKAYRDSISEGAGVVEWKDSKAKAEIQLLVQELI
ncbi:cobyrinic acid ac-diamide synthase [Oleiphilus sp. HI0061]|uniref:division plane positioning ATPase MipZ n=1 Tax=Oleiphilus sp. HI0061 TaxID=1822239 RepID=UPI0007D0287F|nr:division plane positioning ATPase MipZ [Oleiphilus sp. HI0061]KZY62507.1 cobyrinic acid ac-diamide synthase [Oleiphilus sp. HI0061]KZY62526.1 cobyrinic acid ac-diamide synthase [Oleiphilus sp. HI0061]